MKKSALLILAVLLTLVFEKGISQNVSNYQFVNSSSTYVNGLLGTQLSGSSWDEQFFTNNDIGFGFFYGGQIYTKLTVYCNGYIILGNNVSTPSDSVPLVHSNAISVFGMNLAKGNNLVSNVKIFTTGNEGNRVCTIQYWNFSKKSEPSNLGNAQIKLYEADGTIKFSYGNFTGTFPLSGVQVGLSGASDFKNLKGNDWTNPLNGTLSTDTMIATGTQPETTLPDNSLLYSFNPNSAFSAISPTNISFSGVSLQSITVNWKDNSTNEMNFAVYDSTSGDAAYKFAGITIPSTTTAGTGSTYSQTLTGLNPGAMYYFKVYALSEGGFGVPLTGSQTTNQPTFPLSVNVPSTSYPSITAAIDSINSYGLQGNTVINLLSSYTSSVEPSFPVVIPYLPGSNIDTLIIRPDAAASSLAITSSSSAQTIKLNGCKNIIFDGRAGGTGTSQNLTIGNTSTLGNTILFIDGAENNRIQYCIIKGRTSSLTSGVVFFSTSSTTTGNNNNVITGCDIKSGSSTATNMIYCIGSSEAINTGNSILNNNIYDFWSNVQDANGILVDTNNANMVIRENSFYQTSARTTATVTTMLTGIKINNTLNQFVLFNIDSNFIGGTVAFAGGSPMILGPSGSNIHQFTGISVANYGFVAPYTFINANTITNIEINSAPTSGGGGTVFTGIELTQGCASISGNTIGSDTIPTSIVLNSSKATNLAGIKYTGDLDAIGIVTLNKIGGIEIAASGATIAHNFYGIQMANGVNTILGNTIGSATMANSIYNKSSANSIVNLNNATFGIYVSAGINTITLNTIANITSSNINTIATVIGINCSILATVQWIDHNQIYNISSKSRSTGSFGLTAAAGIQVDNSLSRLLLWNNKIYNIIDSNATSVATGVIGINLIGSRLTTLNQNIIQGLNNLSTSANASIIGISNNSDSVICDNSVIRLGLNDDGTDITQGVTKMYGISDNSTNSNSMSKYYFNSVYIGGSAVNSGSNKSAAFYRETSSVDSVKLKNNIFVNGRSNSTATGKHYAVLVNNAGNILSDYNIYQTTGTGGTLFGKTDASATDYSSLTLWQSYATAQDINSLNGDPLFLNQDAAFDNTSNSNLKLQVYTIAEASGVDIAPDTVPTDFENNNRAGLTPVDIGADAEDFSCLSFIANINSIGTSTCEGDSILLFTNAGNGDTYQWLLNNSPVSNANSVTYYAVSGGNYQVVKTSEIGCIDTSDVLAVTVYPLPTVSLTAELDSTCIFQTSDELTGTPDGGIYSGTGVTGNNFNPLAAGEGTFIITYAYTDSNGCSNNDSLSIYVGLCPGVKTISSVNSINIFPNPTSGKFIIESSGNISGIEIVNLLGETVYKLEEKNNSQNFSNKIELPNISNGTYFINIQVDGKRYFKKIIINK